MGTSIGTCVLPLGIWIGVKRPPSGVGRWLVATCLWAHFQLIQQALGVVNTTHTCSAFAPLWIAISRLRLYRAARRRGRCAAAAAQRTAQAAFMCFAAEKTHCSALPAVHRFSLKQEGAAGAPARVAAGRRPGSTCSTPTPSILITLATCCS